MSTGRKLAVIAHSGVGKTRLLDVLRADPRLDGKLMIELDACMPSWYDPDLGASLDEESRADYWLFLKMSAVRRALGQRPDMIAGVLAEGKLRAMVEERGFTFLVLALPEAVHRERLVRRCEIQPMSGEDMEKCVSGQQRLQELGYESLDAFKSPEEIAADIAALLLEPEAGLPDPAAEAVLDGSLERQAEASFRAAVERRDHDAMVAAMAPDVLFHSPVAFRPFAGREAVAALFTALLEAFEEFRYTDEFAHGETTALVFEARVGDKAVQGLDLLRLDEEGLVREFTVMLRPLSAIMALGELMAPKVEGLAKA